MRSLYNEYFKISEDGKIREKVMITRVVMTVVVMVVCLTAMSLTAYAYFSHDVITSNNVIKAAQFSIDITSDDVTIVVVNSKTFTATLESNKTYEFTVVGKGDASTGFCTVSAKDGVDGIYHTQQIFQKSDKTYEKITFSIKPSKKTVVTFTAHWGTSSKYPQFHTTGSSDLYIKNNDTVEIEIGDPVSLKGPKPDKNQSSDDVSKEENKDESKEESKEESAEESQPTVNEKGEIIHIVKEGESLSRIADLYGRNSRDLAYYNDLENPDTIKVGQEILIPPSDWKRPKDEVVSSAEESGAETSTEDSVPAENENV